MQITAKELNNVLKVLSPSIKTNPVMPILDSVKVTKESITGGNMELSVTIPFVSDMPEGCYDFQTLFKASQSLTGVLSFTSKVNTLEGKEHKAIEVKGDKGKVLVPINGEVKDYSEIKPDKKQPSFTLTMPEVEKIAELGKFSAPNTEHLSYIFFTGKFFASSNGFVAGFFDTDKNIEIDNAFYPELFQALKAIEADTFLFDKGVIYAMRGDIPEATIHYRLAEQRTPDFNSVTPKNQPYSAYLESYSYKNMLSILSIGSNTQVNHAKLEFSPSGLLTGSSEDLMTNKSATAEMECDSVLGLTEPFAIGIVINQMRTVIDYLEADSVQVELTAPNKAMMWSSENKRVLVMPVHTL